MVVAHNNIILYWLMRAAGMPLDLAQQAWSRFHLRHASVTRIDIDGTAAPRVVCVGLAGHISRSITTWNNISGEDMSAWEGGEPERRKFSGRMVVLVCASAKASTGNSDQAKEKDDKNDNKDASKTSKTQAQERVHATATHIKGLTEYMVSRTLSLVCTPSAAEVAAGMAGTLKHKAHVLADGAGGAEAVFQRYCVPSGKKSRDTVVLVADMATVMYCLLRSLLAPEQALAVRESYRIKDCSVSFINVRSSSMKIVAVGDTGHLPVEGSS